MSRESTKDDFCINVSRPFEEGTLAKWDNSVPPGCNFGISIIRNGLEQKVILEMGKMIAQEFGVTVFYHRTWVKPGKNIIRNVRIVPGSKK